MRERLRNAFFAWGWLLLSVLPLTQIIGRGVFTTLGLIYYGWALFSIYGQKVELDQRILWLYALLLVVFFLGVPGAIDSLHGLREWGRFVVYSSVFWITWAVLPRSPKASDLLLTGFGISALAMVVTLYVMLAVQVQQPGFEPTLHMNENNLPLVTPFLLYLVQYRTQFKQRHWVAIAMLSLVTFYIVLSQGRAALLGLIVGLLAYLFLVTALRKRVALALASVVLLIAIVGSGSQFLRGAQQRDSLIDVLDAATSYRTMLWRQAVAIPPDNWLIGVGMGNVANHVTVSVTVPPQGTVIQLKHLHNFLFDAWYETGLIGLGALGVWLGVLLRRGLRAWHRLGMPERTQAGVLIAAALAILANALFSYSYTSKQFAIYLFVFLAALAYLDYAYGRREL